MYRNGTEILLDLINGTTVFPKLESEAIKVAATHIIDESNAPLFNINIAGLLNTIQKVYDKHATKTAKKKTTEEKEKSPSILIDNVTEMSLLAKQKNVKKFVEESKEEYLNWRLS